MTGQLLRLLPPVALLDKCERCSRPGRAVYHADRGDEQRFNAVPCDWFSCRRVTHRADRFCCDNHRDLARAAEERETQRRAARAVRS